MIAVGVGVVLAILSGVTAPEPPASPQLEVGARVFLRPEARVHPGFGTSPDADTWRVREGIRGHLHGFMGPASARVELQHVYDWGVGPIRSRGPGNRTGLFQAYVDVAGERGRASGFLRLGRQWFGLGSQRLLAFRYWQPGNLSIDAIRAEGTLGWFTLGAFGALLAPPSTLEVQDSAGVGAVRLERSRGHLFGAAYGVFQPHPVVALEVSAWGWNEGPTREDPARDRRLRTFVGRVFGEHPVGLAYGAEAYGQVGSLDGRDHRAWSVVASLRHEFSREGVRPGFGLVYEVHSGERCVNDPPAACGAKVSRDFQRLLGVGHRDRGFMDRVGNRNTRTLSASTWLRADATTTLSVDYHFFQLHHPDGKWTLNDGTPVGQGWSVGNRAHNLGHEIDLTVRYQPRERLSLRPGYGVFLPDAAARAIAGPRAQHFVYLWLVAQVATRTRR